jgi:hypothetical protein
VSAENDLKSAVLTALRRIPRVHAMRRNAGRTRRGIVLGEPGTPDIEVMLPRKRVLWIELKRPDGKGKIRDTQTDWHQRAAQLEHEVIVCESVQDAINAVVRARDAA